MERGGRIAVVGIAAGEGSFGAGRGSGGRSAQGYSKGGRRRLPGTLSEETGPGRLGTVSPQPDGCAPGAAQDRGVTGRVGERRAGGLREARRSPRRWEGLRRRRRSVREGGRGARDPRGDPSGPGDGVSSRCTSLNAVVRGTTLWLPGHSSPLPLSRFVVCSWALGRPFLRSSDPSPPCPVTERKRSQLL